MTDPLVSVLMPVYNGAKYLQQAMDSVLAQTFADFELIVVDDGSVDDSPDIVRAYSDKRIRLIKNASNLGLAGARNRALGEARGKYVAWLDADDVSASHRLQRQVALLDAHPDVCACGTWVKTIGVAAGQRWTYPVGSDSVRVRMLFHNPLATSSVMVRRDVLSKNNLWFDEVQPPAEDYALWERLETFGDIRNIPEYLTLYRVHPNQISARREAAQRQAEWAVHERQLIRLGVAVGERERAIHTWLARSELRFQDMGTVTEVGDWLRMLMDANLESRVYPQAALERFVQRLWYVTCAMNTRFGFQVSRLYSEAPFGGRGWRGRWRWGKLLAKCLLRYG